VVGGEKGEGKKRKRKNEFHSQRFLIDRLADHFRRSVFLPLAPSPPPGRCRCCWGVENNDGTNERTNGSRPRTAANRITQHDRSSLISIPGTPILFARALNYKRPRDGLANDSRSCAARRWVKVVCRHNEITLSILAPPPLSLSLSLSLSRARARAHTPFQSNYHATEGEPDGERTLGILSSRILNVAFPRIFHLAPPPSTLRAFIRFDPLLPWTKRERDRREMGRESGSEVRRAKDPRAGKRRNEGKALAYTCECVRTMKSLGSF